MSNSFLWVPGLLFGMMILTLIRSFTDSCHTTVSTDRCSVSSIWAPLAPTPGVLRDLVVTVGEDVKAGRYGNFSLFICSEDEATRSVIGDVAASKNVALFVCSSSADLKDAEPVGVLTAKDRETLRLVSQAGGTVTALSLAEQVNIEKTAAGNRLVTLQKKGYLQRVEQPHPAGDFFVDPRSVHLT